MRYIEKNFVIRAIIFGGALVCAAGPALGAVDFRVLYSFDGRTGGGTPQPGLVRDGAGNLYGVALSGGADSAGAIFKISRSGKESVIYSFTAGNDGYSPVGRLVADSSGNLYGTTLGGRYQAGTVFQVSPSGAFTLLYTFTDEGDGSPDNGVILDGVGNLYGTTSAGGSGRSGTVFEITPDGSKQILYNFAGRADGANPVGPLVLDKSGNLYGTTQKGGNLRGHCKEQGGCGTVYSLASDGTKKTLYSFADGRDGAFPAAGVILDSAGNLIGSATQGGKGCHKLGCGVIFQIAADGTETVLHAFSGKDDGWYPTGVLESDGAGDLYGTASDGANGYGTIFQITANGIFTVLYALSVDDGTGPSDLILQGTKLYGTAFEGGVNVYGTAFSLKF
jgi:uncharacterized repeat protein (TIGR03803 family)